MTKKDILKQEVPMQEDNAKRFNDWLVHLSDGIRTIIIGQLIIASFLLLVILFLLILLK